MMNSRYFKKHPTSATTAMDTISKSFAHVSAAVSNEKADVALGMGLPCIQMHVSELGMNVQIQLYIRQSSAGKTAAVCTMTACCKNQEYLVKLPIGSVAIPEQNYAESQDESVRYVSSVFCIIMTHLNEAANYSGDRRKQFDVSCLAF